MAFSNMDDVEQQLGEEKPPTKGSNRTFYIIIGTLGGIMVVVLLVILGLALFRVLPGQRAAQNLTATNDAATQMAATATAQAALLVQSASQTSAALTATNFSLTIAAPTDTATVLPTATNTRTPVPTNTPVIVPTKSPTVNAAATQAVQLTQAAQLTQSAQLSATPPQPSATAPLPTSTALPQTGIAEELGTNGLIIAAIVLVAIILAVRRLRTVS